MVGLRKGVSYSKKIVVPYTRKSKKKKRAYIKAVPAASIVKFSMGNEQAFSQGKFPFQLTLVSKENIQIRDSALEACRQFVNKKLDKEISGQYFFRILAHPHHIQRENKMLTGAGADRMSTGMQLSFGRAVDRAAIVKNEKPIFFVAVGTKKAESFVRKLFKQIKPKLPCTTRVINK